MDAKQLMAILRAGGPLPPVLFFGGREDFLKERAIRRLAERIPAEDRVDNFARFDLGEPGAAAAFAGALGGLVFNDAPRIYVLVNAGDAPAADRRAVIDALTRLPPRTLVVVCAADRDLGTALKKSLGERLETIDFWAPFANKLPDWLAEEARDGGALLDPAAGTLLVERLGSDLRLLAQEIAKLAVCSQGRKITREQVAAAVSWGREDAIYDLIDRIGQRQLPAALTTLVGLWQRGESPMAVWAVLQRTLRDFRLLHEVAVDRPDLFGTVWPKLVSLAGLQGRTDYRANEERRRWQAEIRAAAEGWPPALREVLRLAQPMQLPTLALATRFSRRELVAIWPELLVTDLRLKSSGPDPRLVIERLVVTLLAPGPSEERTGAPSKIVQIDAKNSYKAGVPPGRAAALRPGLPLAGEPSDDPLLADWLSTALQ